MVFISHSSNDREFIETHIINPLDQNNIPFWYSQDEIPGGAQWQKSIFDALNRSSWFVVVLSPNAVLSQWVQAEVGLAFELAEQGRLEILPILIEECEVRTLDLRLPNIQILNFREDLDETKNKFIQTFRDPDEPETANNTQFLVASLKGQQTPSEEKILPLAFGSLTHHSKEVRSSALNYIEGLGWERVTEEVERICTQGQVPDIDSILKGLSAIESHPKVVGLLERIAPALKGDLRNQVILLIDRKRLSLSLDEITAVFARNRSNYEIKKVLGQGLFTNTYLAVHKESDLEYVVRILRPELVMMTNIRTQFIDLGKRAQRYVHQNIVLCREFGRFEDDSVYYCVRDFVGRSHDARDPHQAHDLLSE